ASPTTNLIFNVTAQAIVSEPLTFRWFINGILKFTETLTSGFTSMFSYLFNFVGQVNVTVTVNGSQPQINDTFTFYLNLTNDVPIVNSVILNSSALTNYTDENLTVYWNSSDPAGESVYNITDWRVDGTSISVINLPFEKHANSATKAIDYSTYSNNGTVYGATWSPTIGQDGGGAYKFDGVDDYIHVDADLDIPNMNYTLLFWKRMLDTPTLSYDLLSMGTTKDDATPCLRARMSGAWITIAVDGGSKLIRPTTAPWTQWQQFGVSYNGTTYTFYMDGVAFNKSLYSYNGGTTNCGSTEDLFIGEGAGASFNGSMDDIYIFNRTLSDEQILAVYQNKKDLIVSNETLLGETWQSCLTPNDGIDDGTTVCSNNLIIANKPPSATAILNSSDLANISSSNLTLYITSTDIDGDSVYNTTDWRLNGTSIAVLNLPFEAGSSNSTWTKDYTTYMHNGTIVNATWTSSGYYGGAYSFDGASTYINVGNDTTLVPTAFSVEAWVNSAKVTGIDSVIAQELVSSNNSMWLLAKDNLQPTNKNKYEFGRYTGITFCTAVSTTNNSEGNWRHIVGTWNGTHYAIYLDGTREDTTACSAIANTQGQITVGARLLSGTLTDEFNGTIDQVKIYSRVLSPEQILALYNNRTDIIVSNETVVGDTWSAAITPNDGIQDGTTIYSNNLTIIYGVPVIANITLNSSSLTNYTTENLTVYWDVSDPDGGNVYNITDWRIDGTSIAVLNLPFEKHANSATKAIDYSTYSNNGTVNGATWVSDGHYGGAYEFDGNDDYIFSSGSDFDISGTSTLTHSVWIKTNKTHPTHYIAITMTTEGGCTATAHEKGLEIDNNGKAGFYVWDGATKHSTSTTSVNDSKWHHVVGMYNGTHTLIYVDGNEEGSTAASSTYDFINPVLCLSADTGDNLHHPFNGTIDQVQIFNRSLSPEQILALYNNRTELIVSNETNVDDVWSACLTPNNGAQDGITVCSNNLTIRNHLPTTPVLLTPNDGNNTNTNLTPFFKWDASTDSDGHSITYDLNITSELCTDVYQTGISASNYTPSQELGVLEDCGTYDWTVRAYDGYNYSDWATTFNFSIASQVTIIVTTNETNFGDMVGDTSRNTTDNTYNPLRVQSDSNVDINISVKALDTLWLTQTLDTRYFQFMAGESNETGSFNLTSSQNTWENVSTVDKPVIAYLGYNNSKDLAELELLVTAPLGDGQGVRNSTIRFTGSKA
ncbi:LamG-like jellyroll fold domain-containing protein, partial [Nanoarchaeota archaeon]